MRGRREKVEEEEEEEEKGEKERRGRREKGGRSEENLATPLVLLLDPDCPMC